MLPFLILFPTIMNYKPSMLVLNWFRSNRKSQFHFSHYRLDGLLFDYSCCVRPSSHLYLHSFPDRNCKWVISFLLKTLIYRQKLCSSTRCWIRTLNTTCCFQFPSVDQDDSVVSLVNWKFSLLVRSCLSLCCLSQQLYNLWILWSVGFCFGLGQMALVVSFPYQLVFQTELFLLMFLYFCGQ